MEEKVKFGFGTEETVCVPDMFDSIDDLLKYVQESWDGEDGYPFDKEVDSGIIFVGTIKKYEASDFAPSIDDIADIMTDSFYCECNIDNDANVDVYLKEKAEKEFKAFINKYFELPCTYVSHWFGEYDLTERKWVRTNLELLKKYVN